MVGTLYSENDRRRQAGFNLFVMGINLGSFFSPLITGAVAESYSYHAAFAIPAVFMFIALAVYRGLSKKTLANVPRVAPNPITAPELRAMLLKAAIAIVVLAAGVAGLSTAELLTLETFSIIMPLVSLAIVVILFAQMLLDKSLTTVERRRLIAYTAIFVAATIFWAIEEMQSSIFAVLAEGRAQTTVGSIRVLAAWYQSINPLVIIILAPLLAVVWQRWRRQPSIFAKLCIGLALTAVSFVIPAIGFAWAEGAAKVSPLLLIIPIVLFSTGELFVSPVGLSGTTELAPAKYQSRMMSIWFLANTLGQGINAFCVRFFNEAAPSGFFAGYAIAVVVVIVALLVLLKPLLRLAGGIR
jgi:POT family proton-dependent oligopeptide transporter